MALNINGRMKVKTLKDIVFIRANGELEPDDKSFLELGVYTVVTK